MEDATSSLAFGCSLAARRYCSVRFSPPSWHSADRPMTDQRRTNCSICHLWQQRRSSSWSAATRCVRHTGDAQGETKCTCLVAGDHGCSRSGIPWSGDLRVLQYVKHKEFGMTTSAFSSAFYTLVGFHGAHVAFGIVWIGIIIGQLFKRINGRNRTESLCIRHVLALHRRCMGVHFTVVYLLGKVG